MKAREYADRIRDSAVEPELAIELRKLSELERLSFLVEMLDISEGIALRLAKRCLGDPKVVEQFLEVGIGRVRDLSYIDRWLEALTPKLGIKKVLSVLQKHSESHPLAVSSALYFLPAYLPETDAVARSQFQTLNELVAEREGRN